MGDIGALKIIEHEGKTLLTMPPITGSNGTQYNVINLQTFEYNAIHDSVEVHIRKAKLVIE